MGLLSNFRLKFHNAFFTQVLYGTVASLAIFLTSWDHLDRMRDRLQSKLQNDTDTFDFIVVGAGTSGSVVANRLSQYYSVLLLEAGSEPHPFFSIPLLTLFMPNHPEVDYMYRSLPQKRSFGYSINREASLSQGKGLGGSGNLNFLNYFRGSPLDYDHWSDIANDTTWGYREMRKYFQRIEDYSKEPKQKAGAVKIDIPDYVGLSAEFISAAQEHDYEHVDLNDNFIEGFDVNYFPIYKGIRQGPYQSYIKPARNRKSLTIRKFASVNKILFRDGDGTTQAYAVEYERHGEVKIAKATKEIIVSAGALSTPKILMLSGIGPAEHLHDIGIPVRLDLPVGRNLQDHVSTLVGPFFVKEPRRTLLLGKDIDARSFLEFEMGKGPLTSSFYQASGVIMSQFAKSREEDRNWPDIQLHLSSIGVHKTYPLDIAHAYNLQENLLTEYYNHATGKQSFSIAVTNGRPVARGEVLLSGRDPKDKLMINPKYLEDPYGVDMGIMKDGIKMALKLAENTTSFQKLGVRFTDKQLPLCEKFEFRSDSYWECYTRQYSISMSSFCGTSSMGKRGSKFSVVDSTLRVIGAKGLRIIDASILPTIPVGGTFGSSLAVAEKGADSILNYWRPFDVPSQKSTHIFSSKIEDQDDIIDAFAGFSVTGKISRPQTGSSGNGNDNSNARKHSSPKQKVKASSSTSRKPSGGGGRNVSPSTTTKKTTTTTTTTTQKPDFEPAETRFSHNLSQIMEFLRNSRAINEAIDDETYNELVQNFGDRIVEFMKKNKTDIFFVPVTTTTTTTSKPIKSPATSSTTTTRRPQPASVSSVSPSKNSFGGFLRSSQSKISSGKSEESSSPKNAKQYQPTQSSTTPKPNPNKITTDARKLSTSNSPSKLKPTTVVPKKNHSTEESVKSTQASNKYSSITSSNVKANSPLTYIVTSSPRKVTTLSTSTRPLTSSPSSLKPTTTVSTYSEEYEDTTVFEDDEDATTPLPEENLQTKKKLPTKIVEVILNPDLSFNNTKEVDGSEFKGNGFTKERDLIEYRTEEVRPFPLYPPYKIVSVPGQEFVPNGGFVPAKFAHTISPAILFQPSSGRIQSFSQPAPLHQDIHFQHPISQHLPPLPHFQQPKLLLPPKLPPGIDEKLPIQTAKTVLYYTQVLPRHPVDFRGNSANIITDISHNAQQGSRSSSYSISPSGIRSEERGQNIVQFIPSIN